MTTTQAILPAYILAVDDEPANLRLLSRLLFSSGYEDIELIADPREVVASYQARRPDLILLDINMPHMDGFAVLSALMELDDPLMPPVVVLTAQTDKAHRLQALSLGASDFLSKPFDREELLMRVRNLLKAQLGVRMLHDRQSVLEEMVEARTAELVKSRLDIVQRLGKAAEYRDEETGSHIMRVSHAAALVARYLGWSEQQAELILNAAPMHDIGKIGIPDAVLQKPGRLTAEEFEVIKTHTSIGGELLSGGDSELIRMAYNIALTHHEKWDGSGYPKGLSGTDIPQEGRIVAVIDVFDALTSERPYKHAWTVDAAVALIREHRGTHFDPAVVDIFLAHLDEILALRARFAE